MNHRMICACLCLAPLGFAGPRAGAAVAVRADQSTLQPVINATDKALSFDWPAIRIGTGEYEEGPTGVTVFWFPKRAFVAVDVRGGGPGTVNTDYLRLGYDTAALDAVVFSGGSWYGLESITAVSTALKDDGLRGGHWDDIALAVGAIIYDLGDRRLNEIYPDKRLAQAAFRATRPGIFPLGAHGAGRMAKTGYLYGCNAYSGQGGAFRQIGDLKIAAFVVVNAVGVVTRRDGRVAACYPAENWPREITTSELLAGYPDSRKPGWAGRRNTTISLIVTNQRLAPAQLQRLATQVHGSMGRAIQPFATEFDGDVLYAVSTGELAAGATPDIAAVDLDVLADEVMWDAILASVPDQPAVVSQTSGSPASGRTAPPSKDLAGDYEFSPKVRVRIRLEQGQLLAQSMGAQDVFAIPHDHAVALQAVSPSLYTLPGRYPLQLSFEASHRLIINPGHWQQAGARVRSTGDSGIVGASPAH